MSKPLKFHVKLELEAPQKTVDGYKILATAIVSENWRPIEGKSVIFFLGGMPVGKILPTDANGRAQQEIKIPVGTQAVSVEVQVLGSSATARENLTIPEEAENAKKPGKKPKKVYVTFTGKPGEQKLVISVSDENGNFVPGASVKLVDGDDIRSLKTDEDGTLVYPMKFTEKDRYVEVRVGNEYDQIWRARLNG